jgi:type VI secretion system protein ImpA
MPRLLSAAKGSAVLDLAPWLSPIDGDNPSGESLRNDARFHAIERLMVPQVEVVRDERNNPVSQTRVPVDWGAVLDKAEELRRQGRDLRLLVIVARALANERGLEGLGDGLTLIARTLDAHWDTLHPALRAGGAPRDAALRRLNALSQLQNDDDGLLADLRQMTVLAPRGLGPVSGGDLEHGTLDTRTVLNEAAPGLNDKERAAIAAEHEQRVGRVRAACTAEANEAPERLAALAGAARGAATALDDIERALGEKLGLSEEFKELKHLKRFLARVRATLERPAAGTAPKQDGPPADGAVHARAATAPATAAARAGNGAVGLPDRLVSRDEVIACLDRIIEFYDRTEPASPVPFLARRMRRMVPMDFLELMEDLAPSGLKEFRSLAGLGEDKKSSQRPQGEKS